MLKKIPAWAAPAIVCILLICLYGFTASTRLTWANNGSDGGDLVAAVLSGGIPHPTGYPTYMILSLLLQRLPLGDAYFRIVLLSFFPAALAAGFFAAWVNSFHPGSRLPGAIAGLLWGMSPLLWSQSVIVEVYGLQALFTVLGLWWITLLLRTFSQRPIILMVLAIIFGTALGNHATTLILLPACVVGMVYWAKNTGRLKLTFIQLGAVVLGGLVYIYLPIQASSYPPVNWGNPQTIDGFLWEVTGYPYQALFGGASLYHVVERIMAAAVILRQQVGLLGIALGIIGAYQFHQFNRKVSWACFWIFFSTLAFSIGYNTADSTAYLNPAVMVYCGWIGFSIVALNSQKWRQVPIQPLVSLLLIILLLIQIPATLDQIDPQEGYFAADFAEKAFSQLPENAIVVTSSDLDSFPLWAYQFGFGLRNDLAIIVLPLTQFEWYQQTLYRIYPALKFPVTTKMEADDTMWIDQIGLLNPNRVMCKSAITHKIKIAINFDCSDGKMIAIRP